MGGLIGVVICVIAAFLIYSTGHTILFWLAVLAGIIVFWSWGVMHNYATESAKTRHEMIEKNMRLENRSKEDVDRFNSQIINPTTSDMNSVPNWIATINMIATLTGIILLICGISFRVF